MQLFIVSGIIVTTAAWFAFSLSFLVVIKSSLHVHFSIESNPIGEFYNSIGH